MKFLTIVSLLLSFNLFASEIPAEWLPYKDKRIEEKKDLSKKAKKGTEALGHLSETPEDYWEMIQKKDKELKAFSKEVTKYLKKTEKVAKQFKYSDNAKLCQDLNNKTLGVFDYFYIMRRDSFIWLNKFQEGKAKTQDLVKDNNKIVEIFKCQQSLISKIIFFEEYRLRQNIFKTVKAEGVVKISREEYLKGVEESFIYEYWFIKLNLDSMADLKNEKVKEKFTEEEAKFVFDHDTTVNWLTEFTKFRIEQSRELKKVSAEELVKRHPKTYPTVAEIEAQKKETAHLKAEEEVFAYLKTRKNIVGLLTLNWTFMGLEKDIARVAESVEGIEW